MTIISTKYDLGDVVYILEAGFVKSTWVACYMCKGYRTVAVVDYPDVQAECPTCHGQGEIPRKDRVPSVPKKLTIGQVNARYSRREGKKISYMCEETGVGSGTVYPEEKLFRSVEEAYASEEEAEDV